MKMDSAVRYLGVDIEDALKLSEGIDLWQTVPTGAFSGGRPLAAFHEAPNSCPKHLKRYRVRLSCE